MTIPLMDRDVCKQSDRLQLSLVLLSLDPMAKQRKLSSETKLLLMKEVSGVS